MQLDELLTLAAFAKGLHQEYETRSLPVPEWLDDRIRTLNREILTRGRDALELRLKEIAAQKTRLMTPDEKRAALAIEEEEIKAKLATA